MIDEETLRKIGRDAVESVKAYEEKYGEPMPDILIGPPPPNAEQHVYMETEPEMEKDIPKGLKSGLALVVYQDKEGVHVGIIDNIAIVEARTRKITAEEVEGQTGGDEVGEDFYCQGWIDALGGSIDKLDGIAALEAPWTQLCSMFVGEETEVSPK